MRLGIFTKPCHVEKIVNYLNQWTEIVYIISTERREVDLFEYDVGVSYCWPWKVQNPENWYNYHPGLLPDHKGVDCYVRAILDGRYGVTLHKMTDKIDEGEILVSKVFEANPVNTQDLANLTHHYLFELFKETIEGLADDD